MARKLSRDMVVHDKELRKIIQSGVDPNTTLAKRHFDPIVIKEIEEERNKKIGNNLASKCQSALLERYNSNPKNAVTNNIDEIISNDILKIRQVIQNMIDYGDARVFKVIPQELNDLINTYGMVAQEYFHVVVGTTTDSHVYVVPESHHQCNRCGKYKAPRYFLSTNSDAARGKTSICTECANKLFKKYLKDYKDIREVLILMSHKLDIYVYQPTLEKYVRYFDDPKGKEDIINGKFLSKYVADLYFQKHLNQDIKDYNFEHTKLEGVPFKCVVAPSIVPQIYHDRLVVEVETENTMGSFDEEIDDEEKQLSQSTIRKLQYKFGQFDPQDLRWLERKYRELDDAYDITELSTKKLIIQLCCQELTIVRKREQGVDVNKEYKSFIDTMKELKLTPKQQAKIEGGNTFSSFGEFINECERRGPIIQRDKKFDDVDGVYRFMVAIAGAIAKTLGKKNEYTDAFDKIYGEYSSNLLDLDLGDEDG